MNIFTFGDDLKVNFNPQQPMNLKENLKFEKKTNVHIHVSM